MVVASAGPVHARRDDPLLQGVKGRRAKQRAGALARHPRAGVVPIENDRHSVVKAQHPTIRLADDDRRVRKVVAAIESAPMVPYTGERERAAVARREIARRLRPFRAGPFVKARSRNDAATVFERAAKHRPLGKRLGPGVEG